MSNIIYLESLVEKNVGPLSDVKIVFPFDNEGNPKPVIFVGENGTGKSTVLSNIVDAFFEMASKKYSNLTNDSNVLRHPYYKIISPIEIHAGEDFMYSYVSFRNTFNLKYCLKAGKITVDKIKELGYEVPQKANWGETENYKDAFLSADETFQIWNENVICYFGPDRYEKPVWMGERYYQTDETLHPSVKKVFDGELVNPLTVRDVTTVNLQWLLDIITDSRLDIFNKSNSLHYDDDNVGEKKLLCLARESLETILSKILGEKVRFQLNYRNRGNSRFRIVRETDNSPYCFSLDSLSTGQLALFNMFATIVRYADNIDINRSYKLNDITGIVVIDEIELHLHSNFQKKVIPELIKLFPKIQFVITSHAPLFLLGMKETFGEEGFAVYEMPTAEQISTEKFTEFIKAYDYVKETEAFQSEVKKLVGSVRAKEKPLVITEGPTDWKHLKNAYNVLKDDERYANVFEGLDFDFYEYEPLQSGDECVNKIDMGNSTLTQLCENIAKIPQPVKYIFIADRDNQNTNNKLGSEESSYKSWGNNVFSMLIPVPNHRIETPMICIEHYYTDDEIRTEWKCPEDGIVRRLYLGKDFDERGIADKIDRFCEKKSKCGSSRIDIIDGSSGEKVTSISDNSGVNYALPKSMFAKLIHERIKPFDGLNFEHFIDVFRVLREIIVDR
ncbi:MAG: ATP-binding protein [Lachnospiraceae bacterium]|nr:ATP-binding protein [Lachnospiraceae bacterium]